LGVFSGIMFNSYCVAQNSEDAHTVLLIAPQVSSMQLTSESGSEIHLSASAPVDAGSSVVFDQAKDSSLWLNYSCIKGGVSGQVKNIFVRIAAGNLPEGVALKLQAGDVTQYGQGDLGAAMKEIYLSTSNQRLVQDIASCYTGEGVGKGRLLQYSLLSIDNYQNLSAVQNQFVTVSYTIAD